jgi:hypothetical protein
MLAFCVAPWVLLRVALPGSSGSLGVSDAAPAIAMPSLCTAAGHQPAVLPVPPPCRCCRHAAAPPRPGLPGGRGPGAGRRARLAGRGRRARQRGGSPGACAWGLQQPCMSLAVGVSIPVAAGTCCPGSGASAAGAGRPCMQLGPAAPHPLSWPLPAALQVYVCGLPAAMTEAQFAQLFSNIGELDFARKPRSRVGSGLQLAREGVFVGVVLWRASAPPPPSACMPSPRFG